MRPSELTPSGRCWWAIGWSTSSILRPPPTTTGRPCGSRLSCDPLKTCWLTPFTVTTCLARFASCLKGRISSGISVKVWPSRKASPRRGTGAIRD